MTEKQSISFIQMPPTKDFYIRCQECCDWLNNLIKENKQLKHQLSQQEMEYATTAYRQAEENEQLKQSLLFFLDVANSECSSSFGKDMEHDCQKLFNCSYDEAKKKYGGYNATWWELGE